MYTPNPQNDPNNMDANDLWYSRQWAALTAPKQKSTKKELTKEEKQFQDAVKAARSKDLLNDAMREARSPTLGESIWDTVTNPTQAAKNIAEVGTDTAKAAKQAAKDIAAATKKTLQEGAKQTEKILLLVAVIAFFVAQSKS